MEIERKKIQELILQHFLEPSLKEIYVEGNRDKELISWILEEHGIYDVIVFPIDVIDVNAFVVEDHGLDRGSNRSRVIALSAELEKELPAGASIICVADRDNEDYIPSGITSPFLKFTDYNSIELYLLQSPTIRKLISLVLSGFKFSADELFKQLIPILEELYIIRLANQFLGWNMEWLDFKRYIKCDENISFNSVSFCTNYLTKNGKFSQLRIFNNKMDDIRALLKDDLRLRIRGHDMTELLFYVLKKLRPSRKFGNVETFESAFMGCLDLTEISKEKLFEHILTL